METDVNHQDGIKEIKDNDVGGNNKSNSQKSEDDSNKNVYHPTYSNFPELKMFIQCISINEYSLARVEESVYPRKNDFAKDFPK